MALLNSLIVNGQSLLQSVKILGELDGPNTGINIKTDLKVEGDIISDDVNLTDLLTEIQEALSW